MVCKNQVELKIFPISMSCLDLVTSTSQSVGLVTKLELEIISQLNCVPAASDGRQALRDNRHRVAVAVLPARRTAGEAVPGDEPDQQQGLSAEPPEGAGLRQQPLGRPQQSEAASADQQPAPVSDSCRPQVAAATASGTASATSKATAAAAAAAEPAPLAEPRLLQVVRRLRRQPRQGGQDGQDRRPAVIPLQSATAAEEDSETDGAAVPLPEHPQIQPQAVPDSSARGEEAAGSGSQAAAPGAEEAAGSGS